MSVERRSTAALIAAATWPLFFLLRTNVLNQDGHMLTPKLERDVPLLGAHLSASTVAMRMAAASLAAIGLLHTYTWIIANHRNVP